MVWRADCISGFSDPGAHCSKSVVRKHGAARHRRTVILSHADASPVDQRQQIRCDGDIICRIDQRDLCGLRARFLPL
jgi:hypothetical protein